MYVHAGRNCDLVVEATNTPDAFRISVESARIGGRIVLVGIPDGNTYEPVRADHLRRFVLLCVWCVCEGDATPSHVCQLRHDAKAILQLISRCTPASFNINSLGTKLAAR